MTLPGNSEQLSGDALPNGIDRLAQIFDWLLPGVPGDPALPIGLWLPVLIWTALKTLELCGPQVPDRTASFDAVFAERGKTVRFLALWTALTTLCLCALPTLFVAAMAVYQFRLMRLS